MAQGKINFTVGITTEKTGFNELKAEIQQIKSLTEKDLVKINASSATIELDKIQKEAVAVEEALNKSFNQKLNTNNISTFNKELSKSGFTLNDIIKDWNQLETRGKQATANLTASLMTNNKYLRESSKLLDKMAETMSNTIRWTIASSALNAMTGAVQKAYNFTKDLDQSLNDIQIVTGKGADEMARFAKQATAAAQQLGAVTTDYTKASLIYYQQGLSDEEVTARTTTTVKVANITGQSADAVSEQLTAVWNGYKVSAEESELYIDKLAKVAATTAADLEELSTGMSKVASAANIMGVDIDQLNAQLATIVSVTREAPESIGTALKTVYARMSDIEAGIDTETTLGEYTAQMAEMGINVLDANNHLRDMGDVVEEIGNQWSTLTREQQTSLAQTIAGTRQYSRMMALFDNWDMYQSAKADSATAAGTVAKQNEIYLDSLEAHLNQLTAESEKLYQTLFNADEIKPLVDILTDLVGIVNNLVSGLGGGKGLLGVITALGLTTFGDKIAGSLGKAVRNTKSFVTSLNDTKTMQQLTKQIAEDQEISETAAGKIAKIKQDQLQVEKFLSEEEKKKADALIEQVAEASRRKEQLLEEQKIANNISKKVLGEKGNNLNTEQQAGEIDREAANLKVMQKNASSSFNAFDEVLSLQVKEQNSIRGATAHKKVYDEAQEIIGSDASDEERYSAAIRASEAMAREQDRLNTATDLHAQKLDKIQEILGINEYSLEDMAIKTEQMSNLDIYDKEDVTRLKEIQKIFEKLNEKDIADFTDEDIVELSGAFRDFAQYANASHEALTKTSTTLRNSGKEIDNLEAKIKAAEEANKKFVDSFNTEKILGAVTDITSAVVSFSVVWEQLAGLGDIWSDDDLTTGEKLVQTLIAVASASGMVINTVKQAKDGFSTIINLLDAYNTKMITKAAADEAAATQDLKNTTTSKIKAEATEEESQETNEDSVANVANALTEELVQKANEDTAETSDKKAEATEEESQETNEDSKNNIKNSIQDPKQGLTKLKNAGKGIGKFVSSHAGAVAAIGGGIIALAGTWALLEYYNNKQAKAWEEAKVAAEKANSVLAETQNEWENLNSSIDKLKSGEDTLTNLTKGTAEWKKALLDVNSEVLKLLEQYPELQKYLSIDENGMMSISEEGLEVAQENQLQEIQVAQTNSIIANQKERDAEIEYLKDEWADSATYGSEAGEFWANAGAILSAAATGAGIGALAGGGIASIPGMIIGAISGLTVGVGSIMAQEAAEENNKQKVNESPEFLQIAALYETAGENIFASEETLATALGETDGKLEGVAKALYDNKDATEALIQAYNNNKAQLFTERVQLGAAAVGSDASLGTQLLAGKFIEDESKNEERLKNIENKYGGGNAADIEAAKIAADYLGLNPDDITAKGTNKVQFVTGDDSTEYTMDEIYSIIAQKAATEEAASKEDEFAAIMSPLEDQFSSKKVANLVATMAEGTVDFSKLSLGEIEEAKIADFSEEELQAFADAYGVTVDELKIHWKTGIGNITDTLDQITETFPQNIKTAFENLNIDLSNLSIEQYQKFATSYKNIYENAGPEMAANYQKILETAGRSSDDLIAELMNIDWSSVDNVEEQVNAILEELGINLPEGLDNSLYSIVRIIGGNVKSLDTMQQEYREISNLIEKAKSGAIWSADEYSKLDKEQKKYFATMADGTTLLIGQAYELKEQLRQKNTNEAWNNFETAIANHNSAYAAAQSAIQSVTSSREYNAISDPQKKQEYLREQVGDLIDASDNTYKPMLEAFFQYARTLQSPEEAAAAWSEFKKEFLINVANDNEVPDYWGYSFDEMEDEIKGISSGISVDNVSAALNIDLEEAAALFNAFDGDLKEIYSHQSAMRNATTALEAQTKKIKKASKNLDLLSISAEKTGKILDLVRKNNIQITNYDVQYEATANLAKKKYLDVYNQFDENAQWGVKFDSVIDGIIDGTFDQSSWALFTNSYLKFADTNSREQNEAFWEMDSYVQEILKAREKRDEAKDDLKRQNLDLNLQAFENDIAVAIKPIESQRAFDDFKRNFIEETDFTAQINFDLSSFDAATKALDEYEKELNYLTTIYTIVDDEEFEKLEKVDAYMLSQSDYQAKKEELINNLMEEGVNLLEAQKSIEGQYLNYQEAVNTAYERQVELIDSANQALDHQKSLIELMYGDKAIKQLQNYYASQAQNAQAILDQRKAQYAQDKADYDAMIKNRDLYSQEQQEALTSQYMASTNVYLEAVNTALSARREQFLNESAIALEEFDEQITGIGSEKAKEQWDWMQDVSEDYLNSLDAAFGIEQMIANYNKAANETTDVHVQQKINNLKEQELKILREKDKLSQYDLDRAQKQLDVLQARIALEDAQQNKSQMRLMRGANGAYSYQYVADQNAIDEAREKLNKAQQELVDLDEEQLKSNTDKIYDIYAEMMEKIADLTDEAEINAIVEQYTSRLESLGMGMNDLMDNIRASVNMASSDLGLDDNINTIFPWLDSAWMQTVMKASEEGWGNIFDETVQSILTSLKNYTDDQNALLGSSSVTVGSDTYTIADFNSIVATFTDQINKQMVPAQADVITGLQNMTGEMKTLAETTLPALKTITEEYRKEIEATVKANSTARDLPTSFTFTLGEGDNAQSWTIKALQTVASAATGGYTGEWGPEGKLAVLHEKELVLNKQDTANILSAVDLVRSLGDSMMNTMAFMSSGYAMSSAAWELAKEMIIEQTVNINAEFPNATDRAEIEAAFEELVGLATQHAYENNRG